MRKEKLAYCGFFGFFGFLGFSYFQTQQVQALFWFSFLGFFCYFPLGKLLLETPDERFVQNSTKAKLRTVIIPLAVMFVIGWGAGYPWFSKEAIVLLAAFGWAATFITYALLLVRYERS